MYVRIAVPAAVVSVINRPVRVGKHPAARLGVPGVSPDLFAVREGMQGGVLASKSGVLRPERDQCACLARRGKLPLQGSSLADRDDLRSIRRDVGAAFRAFRRLRSGDDIRSNIHAGGRKAQAQVDERALRIVEIVRPKLVADGMFLVGLDIVGDKLMEINVFSPGGLGSAQSFEGVNFAATVIMALERKVQYMGYYQ